MACHHCWAISLEDKGMGLVAKRRGMKGLCDFWEFENRPSEPWRVLSWTSPSIARMGWHPHERHGTTGNGQSQEVHMHPLHITNGHPPCDGEYRQTDGWTAKARKLKCLP